MTRRCCHKAGESGALRGAHPQPLTFPLLGPQHPSQNTDKTTNNMNEFFNRQELEVQEMSFVYFQ